MRNAGLTQLLANNNNINNTAGGKIDSAGRLCINYTLNVFLVVGGHQDERVKNK